MFQKRLIIAVLAAALAACDDKSSVPPQVLKQAEETQQAQATGKKKHPTTQELLSARRSRTALIPLPLTMEVPPGWGNFDGFGDPQVKAATAGLNLLDGITPNGEVQIQLSVRPAIKQEEFDRIVTFGKKEQKEKPQQILKMDVRDAGNVKIMERQSVGEPRPLTTYDDKGREHTTTESSFNWTISVLVPNAGALQVYELNFIGLTKNQYDKDKDFLNGIVNTLSYGVEPATTGPATAPAPAAPASPAAPAGPV